WVEDTGCKIYAAQAAGCAPIIDALHRGAEITPVKPNTIASSIAIGDPGDGYAVLDAIKDSGGWGETATDEEILEGIKLLARTEGIFADPAVGAEIAATKKLIDSGRIPRHESIVISITGHGYKALDAAAACIEAPHTIEPELGKFDSLLPYLRRPAAVR